MAKRSQLGRAAGSKPWSLRRSDQEKLGTTLPYAMRGTGKKDSGEFGTEGRQDLTYIFLIKLLILS